MNLVCHPKIWKLFIETNGKYTLSPEESLLAGALKNAQNKFLYNAEIQGLYSNFFQTIESEEYDFEDIFSNYILVSLSNDDRLVQEGCTNSISNELELLEFYSSSKRSNFFLTKELTSVPNGGTTNSVAIYDDIAKPNSHWLYYSLLSGNGVSSTTVQYSDFVTNSDISTFIRDAIFLKNPLRRKVHIQSDYLNFGTLFENILGKPIAYCTSCYENGQRKNDTTLRIQKNLVKGYFGNNTAFKVSSNKTLLHPRTIIYNNLVITLNHDFHQIIVGGQNWNITIQLCQQTYSERVVLTNQYGGI